MKIVCIGRNLVMGGMERQLTGLAAALKHEGHEVTLLTYHNDEGFFDAYLAAKDIKKETLIRHRGEPLLCYERRLAAKLRELGPDTVISYGHGANRKAAVAHLYFKDFRLIVSERTANPRLNPFDLYKLMIYKAGADLLVTNSFAQAELFRRGFPHLCGNMTTIPNFVDTALFHPADKAADRGRTFRFVTTARVTARKNIIRLIKATGIAIERGADISVDWYGRRSNSSAYAQRCQRLIDKLGISDRFHIHDGSSHPEELYRSADAFCLPSLYEGTSNSLAEAMASGLPVICGDAGDSLRYVKDGVNGFVFNPLDPASIADAMLRMYSCTEDFCARMGREGRRVAVEKLSCEAFIANYRKIL